MKIVHVQYTLRPDFVAQNSQNIAAVAAEVRALGLPGIRYTTYLLPDGKTFVHLDHFENEEAHQALMSLPSFKKFETELHAAGFEVEPRLLLPGLVATSGDILG